MSGFQICISGASKGESAEEGKLLAYEVGKELAKAGQVLLTGATLGLPYQGAKGYKDAKGAMSFGISPASSKVEHSMKYRLPLEPYDTILYSGLHYIGRDTLLITSSDAVISIGGRMGTLHEFTIALETETPIALLQGAGGVSTEIMDILHATGHDSNDNVLFGDDPKKLVHDLIALLEKKHARYKKLYQ